MDEKVSHGLGEVMGGEKPFGRGEGVGWVGDGGG